MAGMSPRKNDGGRGSGGKGSDGGKGDKGRGRGRGPNDRGSKGRKSRGKGEKPHKRNDRGRGRPGLGRELPEPPAGLFRDLVMDPDRDRMNGARPVVSVREDDDPIFQKEVERRCITRAELMRRGHAHGTVVELDTSGLIPSGMRRRRREALASERWCAARPVVLPGAALDVCDAVPPRALHRLHGELKEPGGLTKWLDGKRPVLEPRYVQAKEAAALFDPERDIERVILSEDGGPDDLWLKVGKLSTYPRDDSLRLRVSFGVEGEDDASTDGRRLQAAGDLAARLVPGVREVHKLPFIARQIEAQLEQPFLYTQAIAYWNFPNGGALFHHDAFAEDAEAPQRGVLFVQVEGRTVWLALSIEDLARRVREFVGWMTEDDAAWLRSELFADPEGFDRVRSLTQGPRGPFLAELALPGCGLFAPVVNRGPEFTCTLADAGHAFFLHPGDALLMPNHGFERTTMHSVFCASPGLTYGLSLAIRDER